MLYALLTVGILLLGYSALGQEPIDDQATSRICISGIYPSLAVFNHSMECGIGAVVPWAGRLWFLTYSPHEPHGSEDKLYELTPDLACSARPESIGGTPANRMIHKESQQLFIGPYVIDAGANVRVIPYSQMPGRLTATMRHLTDPANKVYVFDMEGAVYEVDVRTLLVKSVFSQHTLPGSHGKGAYTAQGRVVFANNGEWNWYQKWAADHSYDAPTGALIQWDGRECRVIERKQFCEVTGPGGIMGTPDDKAPLWATGWDNRSVILELLDGGRWYTFRLPKASHTYDGGHGWYTEWPRIREVGDGKVLMTMHGMFFDFPAGFCAEDTSGLRAISTYHKMVVDFCHWQGGLVFACNDASRFDNPFVAQPQSNLWFATPDTLRELGPPAGCGGPWLDDTVKANEASDPYHFAGYGKRVLHLCHRDDGPVTFTIEFDRDGRGEWSVYDRVTLTEQRYRYVIFPSELQAEWVRLRADRHCRRATAFFHYLPASWPANDPDIFASVPSITASVPRTTGIIRPRGEDRGTLEFLAQRITADGSREPLGYYEVGPEMRMRKTDDPLATEELQHAAALNDPEFDVDAASVILTDHHGRRWRLPKGHTHYDQPWPEGWPRALREVVTERSLLNCHGTVYEVPRESAGGFAAMRPLCTHNRMITDFCSWRGLLVIAGTVVGAKPDGHYFASDDGDTGLWFGHVDDLWRLGKPRGEGGPWRNTQVRAGVPSDPYLMTGYDRKRLQLEHDAAEAVTFTIEVDIAGNGAWHEYESLTVPPGRIVLHEFPDGYGAHWVRAIANADCRATAWFVYE